MKTWTLHTNRRRHLSPLQNAVSSHVTNCINISTFICCQHIRTLTHHHPCILVSLQSHHGYPSCHTFTCILVSLQSDHGYPSCHTLTHSPVYWSVYRVTTATPSQTFFINWSIALLFHVNRSVPVCTLAKQTSTCVSMAAIQLNVSLLASFRVFCSKKTMRSRAWYAHKPGFKPRPRRVHLTKNYFK